MTVQKTIERAWLYKEMWKRPATKIAAELGISSSALKRICDAMDIPTPMVGHWQKKEYGKKVSTPKLPPLREGIKTSWTIDYANSKAQKTRLERKPAVQKVAQKEPEIEISKDLDNLHPLVKSTRAQVREKHKNISWDRRKNRRRINCDVSLDMLDRASLILDTLVKSTESMGYIWRSGLDGWKKPKRKPSPYSRYDDNPEPSGICWLEVDGERIEFSVREPYKRVYLPEEEQTWLKKYDEVRTGLLECKIGDLYSYSGRANWRDGKIQRVEKLLPKMLSEFPHVASAIKQSREEHARWQREREYERELSNFEWERSRLWDDAHENFLKDAKAFKSYNVARDYLEAVKTQITQLTRQNSADENAAKWISWAEKIISSMDPTQRELPPWQQETFTKAIEHLKLEPPQRPSDI